MPSCNINVADPFTRKKFNVDNVDLEESLSSLKVKIHALMNIQPCDQELIFMGDMLQDENRSLQSYGIKCKNTVFVSQKAIDTEEKVEETDIDLKELSKLLETDFYKKLLKKIFKDTESLENLLKATPSIRKDPVAIALLQDPDLLAYIAENVNVETIIERHPVLAMIAHQAILNMNKDAATHQELLQEVSGEENEYDGIDPQIFSHAGRFSADGMQDGTSSSSSSTTAAPQQISAADLLNALSFASMGIQTGAPVSATADLNPVENSTAAPQAPIHGPELEQMRGLGLLDEEQNRRALILSNGNVEVAINLIYENMF